MKMRSINTHIGVGKIILFVIILTGNQLSKAQQTGPVDWSGFFFDPGIQKIHRNMEALTQTRIARIQFSGTPLNEAVETLENLCVPEGSAQKLSFSTENLPVEARFFRTTLEKENVTASEVLSDLAEMIGAECWFTKTEMVLILTSQEKESIPALRKLAKKMTPPAEPVPEAESDQKIEIAAQYIITKEPLVAGEAKKTTSGVYTFDSSRDVQNALLSGDYSSGEKAGDKPALTCHSCETTQEADKLLEKTGLAKDLLVEFPVATATPGKTFVFAKNEVVFGVEVDPMTADSKFKVNLQFRETDENGNSRLAGKVLEIKNKSCAIICRQREDNTWLNILVSPSLLSGKVVRLSNLPAPEQADQGERSIARALHNFLKIITFAKVNQFLFVVSYG